jgi:phage terminase large subunit-like protein
MILPDLDPALIQWYKSLSDPQRDAFIAEVMETINDAAPQFQGDDPVAWLEENFWIPELKGPIVLYPHQKAVLREAHRRDAEGKFVYNVVVWSDIKKSAKSTIAAGVALYRGYQSAWGSIKVIANDLKQAESRVAEYLRRAVTLNKEMSDSVKQRRYLTVLPNNTKIEAIPIDPAGEAGGNDDLIIFSELWGAKHKKAQDMWTEMTISPTKFGYVQRWIETYAGHSGEAPILEQLYEAGVNGGQQLDLSYTGRDGARHDLADLEVYANGDMLCLWNTRPRLPWQTQAYYDAEERTLTQGEFRRVHRNEWVSSTEKFVNILWWDQCHQTLPAFSPSEPVVIGLDAAKGSESESYVADCFAMVMVSRHPSERQTVVVRYCGIWQPGKGELLDFGPIKEELRRLCREFAVVEVAYDPHQLHDTATEMKREGVANFKEFKQGDPRLIADKGLQNLIINRRLWHDGNPLLRQHIDNAKAKTTPGKDGIRIVKTAHNKKNDGAVALSMAASRALYYNI